MFFFGSFLAHEARVLLLSKDLESRLTCGLLTETLRLNQEQSLEFLQQISEDRYFQENNELVLFSYPSMDFPSNLFST